jgi:hypothetical protein
MIYRGDFMNKFLIFLFSALLLITFTGCNNENSKEIIKVANSKNTLLEIKEINDKKEISNINKIMKRVVWKKSLLRPDEKQSYSFWLEKEGNEERISNYEVWFKAKQTIVFDKFTGTYGLVNDSDILALSETLNN